MKHWYVKKTNTITLTKMIKKKIDKAQTTNVNNKKGIFLLQTLQTFKVHQKKKTLLDDIIHYILIFLNILIK